MNLLRIERPTRNTKAVLVKAFGAEVLFSYDTPVAVRTPDGKKFRRPNCWGPTTGRHLNEWGFQYAPEVDDEEFIKALNEALFSAVADIAAMRLGHTY